jgi:hypothetical protein
MVINSLPLFSLKPEEKQLRDSIYSDECEYLGICETFQYNHVLLE